MKSSTSERSIAPGPYGVCAYLFAAWIGFTFRVGAGIRVTFRVGAWIGFTFRVGAGIRVTFRVGAWIGLHLPGSAPGSGSPSPSPRRSGSPFTRLARFVGPNGFPQLQRESAAEFVEIHYDKAGWGDCVMYRDGKGLTRSRT